MLGNFDCFFVICGYFFFKINFFKNNFQEYHQSVKQFGSNHRGERVNYLRHFLFFFFFEGGRGAGGCLTFDISCELSATQTIHIKYQAFILFENQLKKNI